MGKAELVDISTVKINTELPLKERILDYVKQIKNPYCYICNGVVVKIGFTGKRTLNECLNSYLLLGAEDTTVNSDTNRLLAYGRFNLEREAS